MTRHSFKEDRFEIYSENHKLDTTTYAHENTAEVETFKPLFNLSESLHKENWFFHI